MDKCRHFTGIQHKTCEAGVAYGTMRDVSSPPARWPCLRMNSNVPEAMTVCPHRSLLAPEELAAERAKLEAAMNAALAGNCPECGTPLVERDSGASRVRSCPTHGFVMRACRIERA